jgi:hypothetical protein
LIDTLPPGLYEAVFESKGGDTTNPDLVTGNWVMRCEARTLEDIRALGGNDAADERRFATAARVSETNLALYRTFAQPFVRAFTNAPMAEWLQQLHPLRLQYELFSNANPLMAPVAAMAEEVRRNRKPVDAGNPFLAMQETMSRQIVAGLDAWREATEAIAERTFLTIYGLPSLQSAAGIDRASSAPLRKAPKSPLHQELLFKRIAELKSHVGVGGLREAVVRGLLYAGMSRAAVDERGFEAVRRIRRSHGDMPLTAFKALVREQFLMLLIDKEAAVAAIPALLPPDAETRAKALDLIKEVLSARGELATEEKQRLDELSRLFNGGKEPAARSLSVVEIERAQAKAS